MGIKLSLKREIKDFYKNYPLNYWEIKIKMLKYQNSNFEEFLKTFSEMEEFSDILNIDKKLESVINFDIHSLLFQITEALFSIIFALEDLDDEYLWLNLSFPRETSRRSFKIYDKISKLSSYFWIEHYFNTKKIFNDQEVPFWEYLFYLNVNLDNYESDIDHNKDNIIKILHKLASLFSNRDDFNAYKHALRCYPSSLKMSFISERSKKVIDYKYSNHGINYLTKSKIDEFDESIDITFKSFSPNEDLYYIEKAFYLISNVINTRRTFYYNDDANYKLYFFEENVKYFIEDYNLISSSHTIIKKSNLHENAYRAAQEKNFDEAIRNYKRVLQIDEKNYDAIYSIALIYIKKELFQEAIIYLNKYLTNSLAEHYREALYYLAGCLYNNGDFSRADEALNRYLKIYQKEDDEQVYKAYVFAVEVKMKLNDEHFTKTGRNKTNLLRTAEKYLSITEKKGFLRPDLWFKLALIYKFLRRIEKSKLIFEKIYKEFPMDINTILNLTEIFIIEGNLEHAEKLITKALQIDDSHQNTWNLLCFLCVKKEDLPGLLKACKNSLKFSQTKEQQKYAYNNFGSYYIQMQNFQCALYFFNRALKIEHEFRNSIEGKVHALFELNKFEELLKFTKNVEISEENASIIAFKSIALSKQREHKIALNQIQQLIKIISINNPYRANLYAIEGDIYKSQDEILQAIESYRKSLLVEVSNIEEEVMSNLKDCEKLLEKPHQSEKSEFK